MAAINVRYIVTDVTAAIEFYTKHLGFNIDRQPAPGFAILSRGDLCLRQNAGPDSTVGRPRTSPPVSPRWGSALDDRDDEADGREDVPDAHTLGLGADLDDGLAGVVDLPGDLPALRLAARDRLLELLHDLLERVTLAVVEDRHPGRGDRLLDDLLDLGRGPDLGTGLHGTHRPSLPLDLL